MKFDLLRCRREEKIARVTLALEEHKFLKSVNALTTELDKIDIF